MTAFLDKLLATVEEVATLEAAGGGFAVSIALGRHLRTLALQGPDGEAAALGLAGQTLERLRPRDTAGALARADR